MPIKQLKEFLDKNKVKYLSTMHSPAFTSQEIAASAHVSGRELAKIVIVKADGKLAMVVVPANDKVNFTKLHQQMGKQVDLASESDFKDKFPGCEVGAMPPFGNLFDIPVYVASSLSKHENIVFNAGSHSELMQVAYPDFERLVKPQVLE
jgi:Ala-tRNA(Pro) deacylase